MAINSRQKGARGERLAVALFRKYGFTARRGQQFRGGPDSPDILVEGLPFHWEIKVGYPKGPQPVDWLNQAALEAPPSVRPVVLYKAPRRPWRAFVRGDMTRSTRFGLPVVTLDPYETTRQVVELAIVSSEIVVVCSANGWIEFDAEALLRELRPA